MYSYYKYVLLQKALGTYNSAHACALEYTQALAAHRPYNSTLYRYIMMCNNSQRNWLHIRAVLFLVFYALLNPFVHRVIHMGKSE